MAVVLSEEFFAKIAGWEAMKRARAYLAQEQVLSSNWSPPVLKGVVQAGEISMRGGLVIKSESDIENLCHCRDSREWGTICAHSVAVGLHHLRRSQPPTAERRFPNRRGFDSIGTRADLEIGAPLQGPGRGPAAKTVSAPKNAVPRLPRDPGGEPLELFVLLPPNFEAALARGKVMLCFEGQWRGGRSPVNALPKAQPFALSAEDAVLLDRVEAITGGEPPALLMMEAAAFAALLPALAGHPRVTLGKTAAITVTRTPWPLALRATLQANGEIELALQDRTAPPLLIAGEWVFARQTLQPLGLPKEFLELFRGPMRVARTQVPQFLARDWPRWQADGRVEANFQLEDFTLAPQPPRFLLELKGGLAQLSALLQCRYGVRILTPGVTAGDENLWLPDPESPTRYSTRDFSGERAALGRLAAVGFTGPDAQGRFQLLGQDRVLSFFARDFPRWQREWEVTLEARLERSAAENIERVEPQFQITSSGVAWFDLGVTYATKGGEKFSAADIQRLLLSGRNHTRLASGKFAVIDTGAVEELQEVLLDCSPTQHAQGYRMSAAQAGFLEATLREHPGWPVEAPAAWRERAKKQSGEAKCECPPLGELEPVLRPYQKDGVAWLQFLRTNGFGGILADEMGLGKTLQVLALLNSMRNAECGVRNESGDATANNPHSAFRLPHLIVCPTSLVFNWVAEVGKFTPGLRVLALHGPERHGLFERIPRSDLIVTSYALIRRDAERYRGREFDTVVLDEAQHIKNRQTQNAQAVKAVRARHRLVLTGTPLENSVLDLWSIFDFLMPGYLGRAQDFRERYELPIAREKNAEAQARLARRLRPFILRRLKREVAKDLPARLEQVSFCELNEEQRAVYQQVIEASRKEVTEAVGAQGLAKSRMVVLTALLRLRQICCDLRLLKLERGGEKGSDGVMESGTEAVPQQSNTPPLHRPAPSGKFELFGELLEEVIGRELLAQQRQHAHELAEHQHAMPPINHFFQQFAEQL